MVVLRSDLGFLRILHSSPLRKGMTVRLLKMWPLDLLCEWSTDVSKADRLRLQLTRLSGCKKGHEVE